MNRCVSLIFLFIFFAAFNQSLGQIHVQTRTLFQTTTANTITLAFGAGCLLAAVNQGFEFVVAFLANVLKNRHDRTPYLRLGYKLP